MFEGAVELNQVLCPWLDHPNFLLASTSNMFKNSGCSVMDDPAPENVCTECGSASPTTPSPTTTQVPSTSSPTTTALQLNSKNIKQVVKSWLTNKDSTKSLYGSIETWDTSDVTNMASLFKTKVNFNDDITAWNVEKVTTMAGMFQSARNFDKDISLWNTGKVKDMSFMFYKTNKFDQDISAWSMASVTDMKFMFNSASKFNQDLCPWLVYPMFLKADRKLMFMGSGCDIKSSGNNAAVCQSC